MGICSPLPQPHLKGVREAGGARDVAGLEEACREGPSDAKGRAACVVQGWKDPSEEG